MPRQRYAITSLACIALLASACSRTTPFGAATVRGDDGAAALAAVRMEGEREVSNWRTPAMSLTEAGVEGGDAARFDRDGDGKLGATEQIGLYRAVWEEMTGMLQGAPMNAMAAPPGVDYQPPHSEAFMPTNAEVFVDAEEILPAVVQTIQGAQRTIRMDLFLLGGSQGRKLCEILAAKFKAGVDVRILHDPSFGMAGSAKAQIMPVIRYLTEQGIRVKPYPLSYLQRRGGHPLANKFQIDHDKYVVVDEEVAMIGSMNLIDIGVMNHDAYLRLTGGVARELAAIHDATWLLKGPPLPDFPATPAPRFALLDQGFGESAGARLVKTDIDLQDAKTRLLEGITNARKSIHVEIFEFGDTDVATALVEASRRGVDVRVIADPNANYAKYLNAFKSVKLHGTPNLVTTDILRQGGVPVKWYVAQAPEQECHMKLAIFDHERAILGSTNFTYQAFKTFRETSADVISPVVANKLEDMFQRDWEQHARPVGKPTFFEKVIMVGVKSFDRLNLSWW